MKNRTHHKACGTWLELDRYTQSEPRYTTKTRAHHQGPCCNQDHSCH
uniref:Uncharacterized protein n=1 Tax=Anguilla anguilla TaxID=7936 RepID=A0A0E9RVR0_ANGAN